MAKQGTVRGRKRRKEERLVRHTHLSLSLSFAEAFFDAKADRFTKPGSGQTWENERGVFVQVRLLMAHFEGVISARLQTHLEQTPHMPMEVTVRESGGGCVFTQCTRLFHVMREIISRNV
jgi:hypothetical protein